VLSISPKGSGLSRNPLFAQEAGIQILKAAIHEVLPRLRGEWAERLQVRWKDGLQDQDVAVRTILVKWCEYVTHIQMQLDHDGNSSGLDQEDIDELMALVDPDKKFWMIEYSLPELYCANGSKIGELLLHLDMADEEVVSEVINMTDGQPMTRVPYAFRMLRFWRVNNLEVPVVLGFTSHTKLFIREV
jgi:hypothetical protein